MEVKFIPTRDRSKTALLQINDARITFRNFAGKAGDYNREGEREFHLLIPDEEIAEALMNDVNQFGVGWNVKIKAPKVEGDDPFRHMKVKVSFEGRSNPEVYLNNGVTSVKLNEETIGMLDDVDIDYVNMDIRPYDNQSRFGDHRTAYLQGMEVFQRVSRFGRGYAEEDYMED